MKFTKALWTQVQIPGALIEIQHQVVENVTQSWRCFHTGDLENFGSLLERSMILQVQNQIVYFPLLAAYLTVILLLYASSSTNIGQMT